ncbi:MAG TPA: ChbG/HpnK family deacetylase [Acidobacteriaceae bacterium]|jgi:predicted glycoside hydrolase/deacetylase ChbG (UPF0249 family)|nr:ChbG/HpnK family deacetylase [Acidobacteriaceae bacterium]
MSARLIVNADDFGLTPGVNRAIAELHDAGALTSATLMANGPAFEDAVAIARARPSLGVGCHITLLDGEPVSDPSTIPTLLGPEQHHARRSFRQSLVSFALAVTRGTIRAEDITLEAIAQIQKLQRAGIHVTHIDTHKHAHILSRVARPLLKAMQQTSIAAIRNPFEPRWSATLSGTPRRSLLVRALQRKRRRFESLAPIAHGHIRTTNGTVGISATGHLNSGTLQALLNTMPDGTWELVCHPGYNDSDLDTITTRLRVHREVELRALLAAFNQSSSNPLNPSGLQLINYAEL